MEKAKSIHFKITKWQYNKAAQLKNLRTAADIFTYALKKTENGGATVAGFAFRWQLTIYAGDMEAIHFASEEMFEVMDKNLSLEEVKEIVYRSYVIAYGEAASKIRIVGLNTSFPPFEKMNVNLKEIRAILDK